MNNDTPADAMQLKPCPFCGSKKIFADQYVRDGVGISCGDCNTKIYEYHGPPDRPSARERCFTRWNTRTTSLAAQDGLVEALTIIEGGGTSCLLSDPSINCSQVARKALSAIKGDKS